MYLGIGRGGGGGGCARVGTTPPPLSTPNRHSRVCCCWCVAPVAWCWSSWPKAALRGDLTWCKDRDQPRSVAHCPPKRTKSQSVFVYERSGPVVDCLAGFVACSKPKSWTLGSRSEEHCPFTRYCPQPQIPDLH